MRTFLPRARAGACVVLLTLAGLVVTAEPGVPAAGFAFGRLQGTDRYETAQRIAEGTFSSAATAIVANGDNFPDALAGSFLAGNRGGPLLLTRPTALPAVTRTALANLKVKDVVILGGTAAVGSGVENDLKTIDSTAAGGGKLNVTRIGGTDRFDTARLVATAAGTTVGTVDGARTAILATGDRFPDALAAGPAAYSGKLPIVLTPGGPARTLDARARSALQALSIQHVVIMGGTSAVTPETEAEVRNLTGANTVSITRLPGTDRTETARLMAELALAKLGFVASHVNLARGDQFFDALPGGPHGGAEKAPTLLAASPTALSNAGVAGAQIYLSEHSASLTSGHIFGGTGAISQAVEDEARALATSGTQAFAVGGAKVTQNLNTTRTCSATAPSGLAIVLRIYPSANVVQDASGTSFLDANSDNVADTGNPAAKITSVNGTGTSATAVSLNSPGSISFNITSSAAEDVVVVMFRDTGPTANQLDLTVPASANSSPKKPAETFALGCQTVFGTGGSTGGDTLPGPPHSISAVRTATAGTSGTLDAGDAFAICFTEPLKAPDAGDLMRLTDDDSGLLGGVHTTVELVHGTNATFALNTATETVGSTACQVGRALKVTVTQTPSGSQIIVAGNDPDLQYPADVTGQAGITDPASDTWDLAGSVDKTVDDTDG